MAHQIPHTSEIMILARIETLEEFIVYAVLAAIFLLPALKQPLPGKWGFWINLIMIVFGAMLIGLATTKFLRIFDVLADRIGGRVDLWYNKYKTKIMFCAKWGTTASILLLARYLLGVSWLFFAGLILFTVVVEVVIAPHIRKMLSKKKKWRG